MKFRDTQSGDYCGGEQTNFKKRSNQDIHGPVQREWSTFPQKTPTWSTPLHCQTPPGIDDEEQEQRWSIPVSGPGKRTVFGLLVALVPEFAWPCPAVHACLAAEWDVQTWSPDQSGNTTHEDTTKPHAWWPDSGECFESRYPSACAWPMEVQAAIGQIQPWKVLLEEYPCCWLLLTAPKMTQLSEC